MKRRDFLKVTAAGSVILGAPPWLTGCNLGSGLGGMTPLAAAESVAAWLRASSREVRSGLTWPMVPAEGEGASVNLYSGTPGIILFLLELHHATGDPVYLREAMDGAFMLQGAHLEAGGWPAAAGTTPDDPSLFSPGLYTGVAGAGFALAEVWRASGDGMTHFGAMLMFDSLIAAAQPTDSGVIWFDEDPDEASYDIISGSAGVGLSLLYAADLLDFPEARETAVAAGKHLLSVARPAEGGLKWPLGETNPRLMPNFSHGTAGVAYFLARLAEVTGEGVFLDAALQGGRYLQAVARCENDGCLVFHHEPGGEDLFYLGWCHGPAGTARLFHMLHRLTGEDEWREWVLRGARGIRNAGIPELRPEGYWNNVSQCCGDAGVGEFFLGLAAEYDDPEHLEFAKHLGSYILGEGMRDEAGAHWIQAEHRTRPEFVQAQTGWMQGAAGVGGFLLHLDGAESGRPPRFRMPDTPW